MLTDQQRADLTAQAAAWDRLAAHNERESVKLRQMRERRVDAIRDKASLAAIQRDSAIMDADAIAYSWNGDDPKLNEYSAGMVIVERRSQMYSQLATSAKMPLMLDAFAQGITITG